MSLMMFFQKITISSKYNKAYGRVTDGNMTSIACWNFVDANEKQQSIRENWKSLWGLVNAVFDL